MNESIARILIEAPPPDFDWQSPAKSRFHMNRTNIILLVGWRRERQNTDAETDAPSWTDDAGM